MDKFNVIDTAKDLKSLEIDMQNWTLLPYKLRLLSNDDCIRQHGCTVRQFYHNQKMRFMKYIEPKIEPSNIRSIAPGDLEVSLSDYKEEE